MKLKLHHAWTRRVASDEPILKEGPEGHVAVSADFTAYLIRPDGKLLAKKYYKGSRLGRPCLDKRLTFFPSSSAIFIFENKRGKPSGIVPLKERALDCSVKEDKLAVITDTSLLLLKGEEGKFKITKVKRLGKKLLSIDWGNSLIIGTEDGVYVDKDFVALGRVEHVREGPLIAASIPYGVALLDGTKVIKIIEGYEVTGLAWLGDLLAIGDRGGKRVVVIKPDGKVVSEFRFNGAVRSMDWKIVLAIAQRRKVQGYILL